MNNKKRRKITAEILLLVLSLVILSTGCSKKTPGLLETLDGCRGYTRVVSLEEYEFYRYFVERDLQEKVSESELDELVKDYAERVNATFYLGNQLDLCEPYSFEALKLRTEQENTDRRIKLEQNEVIYGLEQFTLETYFQYAMDNLQASLQGYLEEQADEEILKLAREYYETHEEDFIYRKEVVYEQSLDGVTETMTADVDMLSFLGKSDIGLADFLGTGQEGDTYADERNDQVRRVVLKEITYSEKGFKNNAQMALYLLIREELYDDVIEMVAKNNPLEFEAN